MGIRIHELAKQLGIKSKELVALCQALRASGKLSKEVRTASSSLEADDEALVRRECASGAQPPAASGETASLDAGGADAPQAPVRLMQSIASKPKGHSPTQLARPERPPLPKRPSPAKGPEPPAVSEEPPVETTIAPEPAEAP